MNGAAAVLRTLVAAGVEVCLANPGTTEIHLVAGLDAEPGLRGVPTLFEGVATGAADGYGRMTGRPAATLLHLGPGLGNGLANLHNARRARTPVVNVVGDHALAHKAADPPLESDIDALAGTVSAWVRRSRQPSSVGADTAAAVSAAVEPPGGIATLILPADVSWGAGAEPGTVDRVVSPRGTDERAVAEAAAALRSGEPAVLLLGGSGTRARGLRAAARLAAASGARLYTETFPARLERGGGLPAVERLAYVVEAAAGQLAGARHLLLAGAPAPVSFFAYPGRPSSLVPEGCAVHRLAAPGEDVAGALEELADRVNGEPQPVVAATRPERPAGPLTTTTFAQAVGALLPDGAIVVDEANTSGVGLPAATAGAGRHDLLTLTGGAIGQGMPVATGAALACPDRPVVCLEADGSAMYTLQSLWTQAREDLDVTTVVAANRSYAILNVELHRLGPQAEGPRAKALLDLSGPELDLAALARGMGVPATRAGTADELVSALGRALGEPGPHLIEAVLPGR